MKYIMKDYPEYKKQVDEMSVDELLLSVICPTINPVADPKSKLNSIYHFTYPLNQNSTSNKSNHAIR